MIASTLFLPSEPLQDWQGLFGRTAKDSANRFAKPDAQIAKVASHNGTGSCADRQNPLCRLAQDVLRIGKPALVSSMSVIRSLLKGCLQGVSSRRCPCLPAGEDNR
jgi:hypothetical protein